jgi:hypothetical protein
MTNKYIYLILGMAALIGAYAFLSQAEDSGFCTDASILTMDLPTKEGGYGAMPTFTLETQLPTIPDTIGIYKMVSPVVTQEYTKSLADIRINKILSSPISNIVMKPSSRELMVTPVVANYQLTKTGNLPIDSEHLAVMAAPDEVPMTEAIAAQPLSQITKASASALMLNRVQDFGSAFTLTTDTSYLAVDKVSGAESVMFDRQASLTQRKAALPSEDILRQNADSFVSQANLLPSGYQYSGMSYLMRQLLSQSGPQGNVEKVLGLAKYSRTIDGIPVEGAGSTICVMLGDEGKVLGYNKISRDLGEKIAVSSQAQLKTQAIDTQVSKAVDTPIAAKLVPSTLTRIDKISATQVAQVNAYELLPPEEAFKLLQQRGLTTEISNVDTATVTDMHLAYYEAEGNKEQTVTEPIYVFSGMASGPGGATEYREIMSALKVKAGKSPFQFDSAVQSLVRDLKLAFLPGIGNSNEERSAAS